MAMNLVMSSENPHEDGPHMHIKRAWTSRVRTRTCVLNAKRHKRSRAKASALGRGKFQPDVSAEHRAISADEDASNTEFMVAVAGRVLF